MIAEAEHIVPTLTAYFAIFSAVAKASTREARNDGVHMSRITPPPQFLPMFSLAR